MVDKVDIDAVLREAIAGEIPGVQWLQGDDGCDCLYERIGAWTNPYLGQTHQIRLCCAWDAIAKAIPGVEAAVQTLPFYYDNNRIDPQTHQEWDSEEMDMPLGLWYRQLAVKTGMPVAAIRQEYQRRQDERPRKVPKGAGRESRQPDPKEARLALLQRLEATGWRPEDVIASFKREDQEKERCK